MWEELEVECMAMKFLLRLRGKLDKFSKGDVRDY